MSPARGEVYVATIGGHDILIEVLRCSRDAEKSWVDIRTYSGSGWSKRMPYGLPDTWRRWTK